MTLLSWLFLHCVVFLIKETFAEYRSATRITIRSHVLLTQHRESSGIENSDRIFDKQITTYHCVASSDGRFRLSQQTWKDFFRKKFFSNSNSVCGIFLSVKSFLIEQKIICGHKKKNSISTFVYFSTSPKRSTTDDDEWEGSKRQRNSRGEKKLRKQNESFLMTNCCRKNIEAYDEKLR